MSIHLVVRKNNSAALNLYRSVCGMQLVDAQNSSIGRVLVDGKPLRLPLDSLYAHGCLHSVIERLESGRLTNTNTACSHYRSLRMFVLNDMRTYKQAAAQLTSHHSSSSEQTGTLSAVRLTLNGLIPPDVELMVHTIPPITA